MILKGKCSKCDVTIKLDVGNRSMQTEEEWSRVEELLENISECPGHHVELDGMTRYWDIRKWELVDEKAPTDEEVMEELRSEYTEVVDSDEMRARNIITSFAFGMPMTNDGNNWNFTNLPSGKRMYYRR
jgi:hypothetical protein